MKLSEDLDKRSYSLSILKNIVSSEMCVGCGLCIAQDSMPEVSMVWNDKGFLVPNLASVIEVSCKSISVCPFNPKPDAQVKTEDKLADHFLKKDTEYFPKLGRLINTYVGYSKRYRQSSSSGGLGTYVIKKLLETKEVDTVFVVSEGMDDLSAYQYVVLNSDDDITKSSKTRYYPVTMAEVFKKLPSIKGNVAIVGIPCFIKAIRLHQYYNPDVASKIKFLVGIVCGGMKSRFFAEYLAEKSGVNLKDYSKPEFRVKDLNSGALDYSYSCEDKDGNVHGIKMQEVGDMWGTGYFKNNACDFCDDVVAELADISLGDAWIDPYKQDGAGTNIIITRSKLAEKILQEGIINNELEIEELSRQQIIQSQQGGFNHRHKGMKYRMKLVNKQTSFLPNRRFDKANIPFDFRLVQKERMRVRRLSLVNWKKLSNAKSFDMAMQKPLKKLSFYTRVYHKIRTIKSKIRRVVR